MAVEGRAERRPRWSLTGERYRHPSDIARAVFAGAVLVALLLIDLVAAEQLRTLGREVLQLVDGLPGVLVDGLVGLVQLLATLAPIVVVGALLRQRSWSQLVVVGGAAAFAIVGMWLADAVLDDRVPLEEFGYDTVNSWFIGTEYPPAGMLAALTGVLVALSPQMERRWRRTGWLFMAALVGARVLTATELPVRNAMLLAIGALSGSLALVVFGAPRRRIDPSAVMAALGRVGVSLDSPPVQVGLEARFAASTVAGVPIAIEVFGRDQRDTDLLISAIRTLTTRRVGDVRARRSPVGAAEREALAMGLFASAGASVPEPLALVRSGEETALLATSRPHGSTLEELGHEVSDAALEDLWSQVADLQARRLAHRRLSAENVIVDADRTRLVDLRWAEADAADEQLAADVAELLITTTLIVGPERAVGAALGQLAADDVVRSVPFVQTAVCSRATRARLEAIGDDDADVLLADIRRRLAERTGAGSADPAPLRRITVQGAVSLVGSAVLVWYVLSLASDWEAIWDTFTRADLVYVLPILLLAWSTYLTGAMSLLGAAPIQLPFARTTAVMFGQSYLNRFTPANAGGMAMRVRYLQLQGLEGPVAATSIGLTSAASGVAQGVMIVVFLVWGGASDRLSDFELPAIGPIVVAILAVGAILSLVLASTWGRTTVRPWLHEALAKVSEMLRDISSDPGKMAQLLGGATLGKIANIAAFWLAAVAFDVDISFPKAGALYIIATTIGSAVPTPGGVGGVDAALTAALLGYGVGNADAAAIVLLFRVLTFWLPTLPGYVALRYCQRAGIV